MLLPTAASFTINHLNHHLNPGLAPTRTNRLSRVPKLNAGGGAAAGVEQYDGVRIGPPPRPPFPPPSQPHRVHWHAPRSGCYGAYYCGAALLEL